MHVAFVKQARELNMFMSSRARFAHAPSCLTVAKQRARLVQSAFIHRRLDASMRTFYRISAATSNTGAPGSAVRPFNKPRNKLFPLPEPADYQQTLRRSFTVGGIGLHTGEYAIVRVRPAFAGEGRYFVRVPSGANSHLWEAEQPQQRTLDDLGTRSPSAAELEQGSLNAELFFEYIQSQESGVFDGTFAEYFQQRTQASPDALFIDADMLLLPEEEVLECGPSEKRLAAQLGNLHHSRHEVTMLGAEDGGGAIGIEYLLATLECCGVDNARIEIEGGREVPVLDGSALGWATEVQRAGLRPAPELCATAEETSATASSSVQKPLIHADQSVMVHEGESFFVYYPGGNSMRVTVGVNYAAEAPIIGCQWFSWSPHDAAYTSKKDHFRNSLAPARPVHPSIEAVNSLRAQGLLQGGPDYVCLIGMGDHWFDDTMVRFPADEAARNLMVQLLGGLSLLAAPGGSGLPFGHVVAFQPNSALQFQFLLKLQETLG